MPRIEPMPWEEIPPAQRARFEAGLESGAFSIVEPLQIFAYAEHDEVPDDGDRHPQFPDSLLGGRLLELLRIRSSQLGGCEPCMSSRKIDSVADLDAACLVDPSHGADLSLREQRAVGFLNLLATDHNAIDAGVYRGLGEVFTTAEVVELGLFCGQMIGTHRFLHTLDVFGEDPPVIRFDPAQVGVSIHESGEPALGHSALSTQREGA